MLNEQEAKRIADRVLSLSKADELSLSLRDSRTTHIRYARNAPTTSGSNSVPSLSITSVYGQRAGSVSVNQFDDESLERGVRRSEEVAKLAPEDPERMPGLGAQSYQAIPQAYDEETGENPHPHMAKGVAGNLKAAKEAGLVSAGFTEVSAGSSCIANSKGLFGFHRSTNASLSQTARTSDGTGSGWAAAVSNQVQTLDYAGVSTTSLAKGASSVDARDLEPGEYPTILEPSCVANLVQLLLGAMDRRRADEGRSYFAKGEGTRLGEQLFDPKIHIVSDPADPRAPGRPWGSESLPATAQAWIDRGKAANLSVSRYWAKEKGLTPNPGPGNILMEGGSGSLADLIASTKKAVLVTSIWYIRGVDPQSLLYTGLTRDGVFWVEDGQIKHPIHNFRWNDSPVAVLKKVEEMSAPVRVSPRGSRAGHVVVPALRVSGFQFSSVSEAV